MDLNNINDIDVQIAIEEEGVCMAQEQLHENDEKYHRAIIKSLDELKIYKKALEIIRDNAIVDNCVCLSTLLSDHRECNGNCCNCDDYYRTNFIPLILQKAREENAREENAREEK